MHCGEEDARERVHDGYPAIAPEQEQYDCMRGRQRISSPAGETHNAQHKRQGRVKLPAARSLFPLQAEQQAAWIAPVISVRAAIISR